MSQTRMSALRFVLFALNSGIALRFLRLYFALTPDPKLIKIYIHADLLVYRLIPLDETQYHQNQ